MDHSSENHKHNSHHHNHQDHHRSMIKDFKTRFWISLIISIPVLVLSPMIQSFLHFELTFEGNLYVLFALSVFVYFYGGWPFLKGLKNELSNKNPGMMTLIAIAITVAFAYSSAVVFGLEGKTFFWELVTLIDIMLLGHWIEMKSVLGASKSLEMLINLMPSEAHKLEGDDIVDIEIKDLKKGDLILIKSGEKIPADGIIEDGEGHLNESMLTGESKPVKKSEGDEVIGGSINGNSAIKVKVKNTGEESYLNKVINLVKDAQATKSKTQTLADKSAKWLTYISLSAGAITLITWISLGFQFDYALERMVTVMVIACPHALGLAIPLVAAISTSVSAQNGLLIRNRTAFENSRKITTIVFDKTGTLTKGNFVVSRFDTTSEHAKNDVLTFAASVEASSEHPIAEGILKKAKDLELSIEQTKDMKSITGKGVSAVINNKKVNVVSPGYLSDNGIEIPEQIDPKPLETIVYVVIDEQLAGFIALSDEIRPESKSAIKAIKKNNIEVIMATGDNDSVAKAVSDELELDGYYSEVLPDKKVDLIKKLQSQNKFVAMTGDGVNDAPALAQANIGIAIGSGTDIASETADIILVNSNPNDILNLVVFGKATYKKMIQNLVWATAYNAFAIPLAAGVLFSIGFILSPAVGAIFMSLSTVIVAVNAQLLKIKINK